MNQKNLIEGVFLCLRRLVQKVSRIPVNSLLLDSVLVPLTRGRIHTFYSPMNILLLGSGGREHALAWKMAQSELMDRLFIAPGNPGTETVGENVPLNLENNQEIIEFIASKDVSIVVVGPEAPLVNGVHNAIIADSRTEHVTVIGPKRDGAELEGSKDFSKKFMLAHEVPTASYKTFDFSNLEEGYTFLESLNPPFVLKADGLAAGKGVIIEEDLEKAKSSLKTMIEDNPFKMSDAKVVIEEFLDGVELSVFILTDGKDYLLLPTAKDYKRIGEGDTGLNTGGMGALSPAPIADESFMQKVEDKVIKRTLNGLQKDGISYHGFLFIGLMRVDDEPYVIEYNVRMGDPETEAVLPRIESDLVQHFAALGKGELGQESIKISEDSACTIMMVSGGYPEAYEKGKVISGTDQMSTDAILFHAGTKMENSQLLTNGGRVLTVTSLNERLEGALAQSFQELEKVSFEGAYYRKDIGYELKESV